MKKILLLLFVFVSVYAEAQIQFLGAPNVTVVNRGNFRIDSILYLPKREKTPTDTGALRYQISDSSLYVWTGNAWRKAKNDGTVTSVGLTMPSAFAVANSPVTSSGTLAVTATGTVAEYIRGDGTLGTLPSSGGGGGSGVNYYLNGSVSQGTIGGSTYYEMNKTPVIGAGTDFTRNTDGIVAQFITDSLDPNRLLIPAGAWNFELYFSASSAGGTPSFYIELFEYDGTNFTSIASSVSNPISITNGTAVSLYVASLAVPETVLTATDRLAVRVSVNVSGRTITLHTEDNNLAQVITTFSGGLVSLNGLTANDQFFTTGTSGSDFNISSTSATHTFNLPTASSTVRGALSSANWTTFNNKVNISDTASMLTNYIRHGGYGLTKTGQALSVDTLNISTKAWRQKGVDSVASVRVGGTGTTNRVAKFTASGTVGNSQTSDDGSTVLVGQAASSNDVLQINGNIYRLAAGSGVSTAFKVNSTNAFSSLILENEGVSSFLIRSNSGSNTLRGVSNLPMTFLTNDVERMRIFSGGEVGIGTTSASYKLDITGTLRNTTGAAFATSSGNVLIGTTTDGGSYKLDVQGALRNTTSANLATGGGGLRIGDATTSETRLDVLGGALLETSTFRHTGPNGGVNIRNTGTLAANRDAQLRLSVGTTYFGASDAAYQLFAVGRSSTDAAFDIQHYAKSTFTRRFRIDTTGNISIGDIVTPSERLDVSGRTRIRTIDSTATAMNMLYADANGVIKKAAVPSGGSGTVTSVATGFGLSGGTITTTGTLIVDSASVATRARVQKGIDSVASLTSAKVGGTGITGYFPKWTGTATQDTSQLFQLGRNIGIGTASPTYRIHLPDAGATADQAMIAGMLFGSDGNGVVMSPGGTNLTIKGGNTNGYIYSSTVGGVGRWGINTISVSDAVLSINGDVKIVTIDSTSTARNMLYQDANGVIKKSAALTMADDVMTASGSWVATKDAGSGVTINNVAYTTNGTTKMVTIDGNFYTSDFTQEAWVDIATIVTAYRPKKSVYFPASLRYEGADFERADNTDFTGSVVLVYGQLRVTDDGKIQVYASISSNNIAAGGTSYFLIPFQVSYIIK